MIETLFGVNPAAIGAALLAAIASLFVAFFKGKKAALNEQASRDIKAVETAKKVDDDVAKMTPDHRRKELAKWSNSPR